MIHFFYGPNSYEARAKIRQLITDFNKSAGAEFSVERIEANDPSIDAPHIINAIASTGLFSPAKLVVIEDLLADKAKAEAVVAALNKVPKDNTVIFLERQPDERTKAFKDLKKVAKTTKFDLLSPPELKRWLNDQVKQLDGKIDSQTADFLIERVGADQWQLVAELTKLINYDSTITQANIKTLVEPNFEQTIFDLVEALNHGNSQTALKLYRGLRANKAQPIYIMAMIGWAIRNLLIAAAASNRPPRQIASDFGMNPYVVTKSLQAASGIDPKQLRAVHQEVLETDYQLKSSSLDPDILLEQLIVRSTIRLASSKR